MPTTRIPLIVNAGAAQIQELPYGDTLDVSGGNIANTVAITASGNITGSYFIGNGSQLTGITSGGGITVGIEETANTEYYPIFGNTTSGALSTANVANVKLTFVPDTGLLSASVLNTASGFSLNPATISQDYSIPTGYNAGSYGPITVIAGVTVTIPTGSAWTIN